jgi:hypothetical protein
MSEMRKGPLIGGASFDDDALRLMMAQEVIQSGRLPRRSADRMWGGAGDGETCVVCGRAISSQELGYELEFAQDGQEWASHFLHIRCFAAWESECRNGDAAGQANQDDETTAENRHLNGRKLNGHEGGSGP